MFKMLERCTIIQVQSWDVGADPPTNLEHALGTTWPKVVGTVARGRVAVVCVGPTDWLVLSANPDDAGLLLAMEGAFSGTSFRATNMSSALTRIKIRGLGSHALLTKGCSLDVHPDRFPPGRSARTRFAGMPVVIRYIEPDVFELTLSLSYQEYLLAWLANGALEFEGHAA